MVGAMPGRAVAMPVGPLDARQQAIQGGHQVVVGAGPDLDHDEARGRVRDEDRQEPVAAIGCLGDERRACRGQVVQAAAAPGPDRQLARLYGKMLRIASRSRPSPPPAGADS